MEVVLWLAVVGIMWTIGWRRSGLSALAYFCTGAVTVYVRLWHRGIVDGGRRIPPAGPALVVANHVSGTDSAFLTAAAPRPLCFLVAAEYQKIPGVGFLLRRSFSVPVGRHGRDVTAVRTALRRLEEGHLVCIFPEGGLANAGRRLPRRGKAGAALLALRSGAPVIPVCIEGGPMTSDIGLAWLKPSRVRLKVGQPLDLSAYPDRTCRRKVLEAASRTIMAGIARLADQPSRKQRRL